MTALGTAPLTDSVAIVTGASSGIGEAIAGRLASLGAAVALVARRKDRLADVAARLSDDGGSAAAFAADITHQRQAQQVVTDVAVQWGRVDILVNAAGVMLNGPTPQATLEEWDTMVDVNLKGLMYVTKAALPYLVSAAADRSRGVSDVVNVGSIAGRSARSTVAIYNATKFGVTAATEAWRQEYARSNVRFGVIQPGAVDTELFGHQQAAVQEFYEGMFTGVEKLHPDDIAEAVAYMVTGPRRRAVNEIVIRPTDQM